MIALTKNGYDKFIQGTKNIFTNVKVAPLAEGITSGTFTKTGVNAKRLEANANMTEFDIDDFTVNYDGNPSSASDTNNKIKWRGKVNLNTQNFALNDDTAIDQAAAVIDTADDDEPLGLIKIYPNGSPITYSALNSAPVNIDYTSTGMAQITFKENYYDYFSTPAGQGNVFTDIFPKSILKLPFFDNTVTCNLLTDLRIALLSAEESDETTFNAALYLDSKSLSTIESMDNNARYHYISGGVQFNNLGMDGQYAALSATDTTFFIPGLTINNSRVFAVVYFEDTSSAGGDVMSDVYKQNSYILTTVSNANPSTTTPNNRFSFKQSVIIDALNPASNNYNNTSGILAMNNVIGPGLSNTNRNEDIPD